jgi:HD superfamily phosphohydrolase
MSKLATIEVLLQLNLSRWNAGASAFKLQDRRCPPGVNSKVFRSAIYGNMEFEEFELRLIDSFYLQRLRHVSQMGLIHLVYPDARHSRFEHSLGVLWSLKSLITSDGVVKGELKEVEHKALSIAALVHDVGHGPFSHTTETLLEILGIDIEMRRPNPGEPSKTRPHERRCRDIIHDADFLLSRIGTESYSLHEFIETQGVDPKTVSSLVIGHHPSPLLNLLTGFFDVDKMDYFRRDAFFTGTLGGGVDMEAIQRWVRIVRHENDSVSASYDERLVGHLLHMLFGREHVYNMTAYHPVARAAAALVIIAADLMLRALQPEIAARILTQIELLDDREFVTILELSAACKEAVRDEKEATLLRRVIERLNFRRLHKRVRTLTRREFSECFKDAIPLLTSESKSRTNLPPIAYCRISDIASGRYVSYLAEGTESGDDLAILDLTPNIGPMREQVSPDRRTEGAIESLTLVRGKNTDGLSLGDWLDAHAMGGGASAMGNALEVYQAALWRALVLVPARMRNELVEKGEEDSFTRDFASALSQRSVARPLSATRNSYADTVAIAIDMIEKERHAKQ